MATKIWGKNKKERLEDIKHHYGKHQEENFAHHTDGGKVWETQKYTLEEKLSNLIINFLIYVPTMFKSRIGLEIPE